LPAGFSLAGRWLGCSPGTPKPGNPVGMPCSDRPGAGRGTRVVGVGLDGGVTVVTVVGSSAHVTPGSINAKARATTSRTAT
jgi:hypothetical protein